MTDHPRSKPKSAVEISETGRMVAKQIKARRQQLRLTQTALAGAVAERGRPMTASTINKIETCERRVDVDDLVALASALETDPARLLSNELIPLVSPFSAASDEIVGLLHEYGERLRRLEEREGPR